MTKMILVTGSSGFLGISVCQELVNSGYDLKKFDICDGENILDPKQLISALQDCDVCIHLAAISDLYEADINPEQCHRVNIEGTRIVAQACLETDTRLLYASTCCAYGNNGIDISDECSPVSPTELYAETKLMGEKAIEESGCEYTLLRLATFYGPKMRKSLATSIFLEKIMSGRLIEIHGDGFQTRCYTHVDDIAQGIRIIIEKTDIPKIINISDNRSYSVNELVNLICEITGKKANTRYVDDRPGQIRSSVINSDRLQRLGWQPQWDLYTGLTDCFQKSNPTTAINVAK